MADTKPKLQVEKDEARTLADARTEGFEAHAQADGRAGAEETPGEAAFRQARDSASSWASRTFAGHRNAVIGGIVGIVIALLIFAIGFLRTLFIAICVGLGIAVGMYVDGDPRAVEAIRRLFSDRNS